MTENKIDYEIVFINDGSKDKQLSRKYVVAEKNSNISAVNFSRNFGKESAAGLNMRKVTLCVLIDCDLQHPPKKKLKCIAYGKTMMLTLLKQENPHAEKKTFI